MRIPPLRIKILLGSNPLKSIILVLVRRLAIPLAPSRQAPTDYATGEVADLTVFKVDGERTPLLKIQQSYYTYDITIICFTIIISSSPKPWRQAPQRLHRGLSLSRGLPRRLTCSWLAGKLLTCRRRNKPITKLEYKLMVNRMQMASIVR